MKDTSNTSKTGFRTHKFYKLWLKVASVVIAVAAPIFFLGTMESTMEPARIMIDILSWPMDGQTTYDSADTRFISALAGGFLLGWGGTVWLLSVWVYDHAPEGVRKSVLIGMLAWFVLDTTGSILSGNPANAIFNTLILFIGVGPLWLPVKEVSER